MRIQHVAVTLDHAVLDGIAQLPDIAGPWVFHKLIEGCGRNSGNLLGGIAGVLLALNVETIVPLIEHLFHVEFLSADVYYISELPSDLEWSDVIRICGVSLVLSLAATLYPAWRAARTQPAEALRYE